MKIVKKIVFTISIIFLMSSVVMINGCGSNKESKSEGCPTGSFLANDTDTITGPLEASFTGGSSFGNPWPGGSVLYAPVVFTVSDASGAPRNKVCLIVYTDGFWYSDHTYSMTINGSGPMNTLALVTNDYGNVVLYWSTEVLPSANPAMIIPPATTITDGSDQSGESWITAYSGGLSKVYSVDWTVKGEPAQ